MNRSTRTTSIVLSLVVVSTQLAMGQTPVPANRDGAAAAARPGRSPPQPIDEEYTRKTPQTPPGAVLLIAAGGLSAGLPDGPNAGRRAGRHRWRAQQVAVLQRGVSVLAPAGEGEPAGEGVLHWYHGREPGDDRGGGGFRGADVEPGRQPRKAGQAGHQ